MSLLIGGLAASRGAGTIPWAIVISALTLLIALAFFRFIRPVHPEEEQSSGTLRKFMGKYPVLPVVLVGCTLIYTSHVYINNFLFQIVTYKGGTSAHMGVIMGTAGILEVLTMFLFPLLLRWKDSSFWFRLCGILDQFGNLSRSVG